MAWPNMDIYLIVLVLQPIDIYRYKGGFYSLRVVYMGNDIISTSMVGEVINFCISQRTSFLDYGTIEVV